MIKLTIIQLIISIIYIHIYKETFFWSFCYFLSNNNKQSQLSPGSLGAGLQEGVSKQSDRPVDWLVNPCIIFLSEVADLPSQGLPPVHQILSRQNQREISEIQPIQVELTVMEKHRQVCFNRESVCYYNRWQQRVKNR